MGSSALNAQPIDGKAMFSCVTEEPQLSTMRAGWVNGDSQKRQAQSTMSDSAGVARTAAELARVKALGGDLATVSSSDVAELHSTPILKCPAISLGLETTLCLLRR